MAAASRRSGGVVLFDARGERLRPAPLEVKEGDVTSVAFGPEGQIAAGYSVRGGGGGVVLFDARGERLRPAPLEVKEGSVTSVAFGPEGQIAAGYGGVSGGGVVLFDARGERLRPAPLEVKEGYVTSVAFGPEGQIAAGYGVGVAAAWCSSTPVASGSDPRRWRSRRAMSIAWPSGRRARSPRDMAAAAAAAAWCSSTPVASGSDPRRWRSRRAMSRAWPSGRRARSPRDMAAGGGGGVVLFDARGERLRPAPLEVKEGYVTSVAFGPEGQIAAGYGVGVGGGGGVVLFDARGERLRPAPLEVKEGGVTSVAFGPEGQIAAGYGVASPAAAWCSSTPGASGSDPRRWRSRRAMSGAWPSGRRARSPRDMRRRRRRRGALRRPWRAAPTRAAGGQGGRCHERGLRAGGPDRRGIWRRRRRRRRGAVRRPGRAAPTRAAGGQGGRCHERGLRAGGQDRRGICGRGVVGGVVLFDADPASWLRKAGQTANRNFTRLEWTRYFPETSYRRTIRSLPWPHDLPEAERKQAEAFEKEHPEGSDAS